MVNWRRTTRDGIPGQKCRQIGVRISEIHLDAIRGITFLWMSACVVDSDIRRNLGTDISGFAAD